MRGFPLEKEIIEHGAVFLREAKTVPRYKMRRLAPQPSKPGNPDERTGRLHLTGVMGNAAF